MKKLDVMGKTFGRLTVIGEVPKEERNCKQRLMICQCECGKITNVRLCNLTSGNTTSCGCFVKENARMLYEKPIINERFGRLLVISTYYDANDKRRAICHCDCGNTADVGVGDLFSGQTHSCGCLRKESTHNRRFEDITGQTFGELTAIQRAEDYISPSGNHMTQWVFRCSCGKEIIAEVRNVKTGRTKSCGHIGKSYAEFQIYNFLKEHKIHFDFNAKLEGLVNPNTNRPLFMDFIIWKDENTFIVIEHQGEQHFYQDLRGRHERGKSQRDITDPLKKAYCKEHNISLYETRYDEDYIAHLQSILIENQLIPDNG